MTVRARSATSIRVRRVSRRRLRLARASCRRRIAAAGCLRNHPLARKDTPGGGGGNPNPPAPGVFTQVSRLGHPLVNEVVIRPQGQGQFNGSEPKDDIQFLDYVTHPTLAVLVQVLFGVQAPAVRATISSRCS